MAILKCDIEVAHATLNKRAAQITLGERREAVDNHDLAVQGLYRRPSSPFSHLNLAYKPHRMSRVTMDISPSELIQIPTETSDGTLTDETGETSTHKLDKNKGTGKGKMRDSESKANTGADDELETHRTAVNGAVDPSTTNTLNTDWQKLMNWQSLVRGLADTLTLRITGTHMEDEVIRELRSNLGDLVIYLDQTQLLTQRIGEAVGLEGTPYEFYAGFRRERKSLTAHSQDMQCRLNPRERDIDADLYQTFEDSTDREQINLRIADEEFVIRSLPQHDAPANPRCTDKASTEKPAANPASGKTMDKPKPSKHGEPNFSTLNVTNQDYDTVPDTLSGRQMSIWNAHHCKQSTIWYVLKCNKKGAKRTQGAQMGLLENHMAPVGCTLQKNRKDAPMYWRCKSFHTIGIGAGFNAYMAATIRSCVACQSTKSKGVECDFGPPEDDTKRILFQIATNCVVDYRGAIVWTGGAYRHNKVVLNEGAVLRIAVDEIPEEKQLGTTFRSIFKPLGIGKTAPRSYIDAASRFNNARLPRPATYGQGPPVTGQSYPAASEPTPPATKRKSRAKANEEQDVAAPPPKKQKPGVKANLFGLIGSCDEDAYGKITLTPAEVAQLSGQKSDPAGQVKSEFADSQDEFTEPYNGKPAPPSPTSKSGSNDHDLYYDNWDLYEYSGYPEFETDDYDGI
ncbi:hypothetical protein N0V90_011232 [Kalmusia sp. IMI 367209]|nr:hypothetical protein N0V90_011232 [Kalmusia sp. IMI 367209]